MYYNIANIYCQNIRKWLFKIGNLNALVYKQMKILKIDHEQNGKEYFIHADLGGYFHNSKHHDCSATENKIKTS